MNSEKPKRLGFFLSFKQSEYDLYKKVIERKNYTRFIKELIEDFFNNTSNKANIHNNKTIELTVDDICKIISSVNLSSNQGYIMSKVEEKSEYEEDNIPEDMISGL